MVKKEKNIYHTITLKKTVVFPAEKVPLLLEGEKVIETVNRALKDNSPVVLIFRKNNEESEIGVLAKILQSWFLSPTTLGVVVEGSQRVKIVQTFLKDNLKEAEIIKLIPEKPKEEKQALEIEAFSRIVFDQFKKLLQLEGVVPFMIANELQKGYLSSERTSDIVAAALKLNFNEELELLETLDIKKRLELLNAKLAKELSIAQTEKKIESNVAKEISRAQNELLLRERLKAIEKELGMFEEEKEYDELKHKIKQAKLSEIAKKTALKELERLKRTHPASAEYSYIRTYLDWIIEIPWTEESKAILDLKKAREILDKDHYGLEKPKERVLEYLAVQKLTKGKGRGTIMCFVGPPGTGKTSVGKSIARAMGRNFVRISLGGIRDEAEIRGHRRTYVGALPGRIIQSMKIAGTKNPVFMLDEVDKIGTDFRGDPSAALLEVLDPEQNNVFSDHYIEMPFDLSKVFFITTANILDPIPPSLRDRMEVIEFPGYIDEEKFQITKQFLLPRVLAEHGLDKHKLQLEDKAIQKIINKYTCEAGIRNLERKLAEIARKIAKQIAEDVTSKQAVVTESNLSDYLGPEKFEITMREAKDEIGIATGMAWTPMGGEIIFIEAMLVPGQGKLILTGQLGKIMKESAKAALSYIRSKSKELNFDSKFYYKSDIHIHVPSGAIAKDGPSAGIAIATALASILTKKKIRKEVALSGEITLSGKILSIGGVKEKVMAAHRAGVEVVSLPKGNEKDMLDIPKETREELKFKFVKHMDEVLKIALK